MNKLRCLILFTICLLCVGCENPCENILPYYITDKYISVGQEKDLFEFAGAYIEIFNNTDLEVEQVTVNFMLYDENGKSAGIYGNQVSSSVDCGIIPHKRKTVVVSLDNLLGPNLEKSYQLDFVYISRIVYTDGTVWQNPLGLFAV